MFCHGLSFIDIVPLLKWLSRMHHLSFPTRSHIPRSLDGLWPAQALSKPLNEQGLSLDRLTFRGIHTQRKPTVYLSPHFTQAVQSLWQETVGSQKTEGFIRGLSASSFALDNGGTEAEGIAAMILATGAAHSKNLQATSGEAVATLVQEAIKHQDDLPDSLKQRPEICRVLGAAFLAKATTAPDSVALEALRPQATRLHTLAPTSLSREVLRTLQPDAPRLALTPALPPGTGKRFTEALDWAIELHKNQIRLDTGAPYIIHLMHVAALVLSMGGSEDAAIAALLHDAPEDQGGDSIAAQIRKRFGEAVADMVADCTQPNGKDWMTTRNGYIKQVQHPRHLETHFLVAADKMNNLQTLTRSLIEQGSPIWNLFTGKPHEQLWFYRSVRSVLKAEGKVPEGIKALDASIRILEGLTYPNGKGVQLQNNAAQREFFIAEAMAYATEIIAKYPEYGILDEVTNSLPSSFPTRTVRNGEKDVPDFPPERQALHRHIIETEYARFLEKRGPNPTPKKVAHIVTGPMGAGKSCVITNALPDKAKAILLDADLIRPYFPQEYHVSPDHPQLRPLKIRPDNGLGAGAVQRESSYVGIELREKVVANGDNFVISYFGSDLKWDIDFIQELKGKGYEVFVHHISVPLKTSIDRMLHRFKTEGRYTQPELLVRLSKNSTPNFLELKEWGLETGLIDGYSWYYNGGTKGEPPILLESFNLPDALEGVSCWKQKPPEQAVPKISPEPV